MNIAALILAAGASSRMGKTKQLLSIGNTTILNAIIQNTLKTKVKHVFVVLGSGADSIKKGTAEFPITTIINSDYKKGLSSSIVAGMEKLSDYEGVLIILGDQPKVDARYLNDMISEFEKNQEAIIASDYNGINGVPALFPKKYYPELFRLKGDKGAKYLLNSDSVSVKTIKSSVNLLDIDTPEDYQKLIQDTD